MPWQVGLSSVLFGLSHADNFFLPGSDPAGVWYQMFEAVLIGMLFTSARLRLNAIWPLIAVHAPYDFMLLLAFGHAFPVAPTPAGFLVDTLVNACLAAIALLFVLRGSQPASQQSQAA